MNVLRYCCTKCLVLKVQPSSERSLINWQPQILSSRKNFASYMPRHRSLMTFHCFSQPLKKHLFQLTLQRMLKVFPDFRLETTNLAKKSVRGGMGVVYRAQQRSLDRTVALKMIPNAAFASKEDLARLRAEALAAGGLSHPNIVPVYDVGEHDGQPWFSMQLLDGETLSQKLASGPMKATDAVELLIPSCRRNRCSTSKRYPSSGSQAIQHSHHQGWHAIRHRFWVGKASSTIGPLAIDAWKFGFRWNYSNRSHPGNSRLDVTGTGCRANCLNRPND